MADHNNIFDADGVIPPSAPDPWNDNAKLRAALEHWQHEVGKLHSQVDRLKHDRDIVACALMERHDADVIEITRMTRINADLTAANAALMVRVEEARVMAEFYADASAYEHQYERLPCDCCTDIYKPIERDEGATARAWLAGGAE